MEKHFHVREHEVWLPYRFSVGPVFNRFYEGLKEGKILGNKCPKCRKVLVPPRSFCPDCYVDMTDWVEAAQEGELVSWVLGRQEFFGMPMEPPFIGGLIRLDMTDCNFLHLVGGFDLEQKEKLKKLRTGIRVKAVWRDDKKGHLLDIKYFQPI